MMRKMTREMNGGKRKSLQKKASENPRMLE